MTKNERLQRALAEIKALPDAYFDTLMQKLGLSTKRCTDELTESNNKAILDNEVTYDES